MRFADALPSPTESKKTTFLMPSDLPTSSDIPTPKDGFTIAKPMHIANPTDFKCMVLPQKKLCNVFAFTAVGISMRWAGKKCMAKVSMGDTCRDAACMHKMEWGVTVGQTPLVLILHLSMFCETSAMIFLPRCALTSSCHTSL